MIPSPLMGYVLRTSFGRKKPTLLEILWIQFKIREGNKCDHCDLFKGRIYLLSQNGSAMSAQTDKRMDRHTDGHYQVHYLPASQSYAVDNNYKSNLRYCSYKLETAVLHSS